MKEKTTRSQGFSILEIVLGIVALGLLGFIIFTAYQAQNKPAPQPAAPQTTSQTNNANSTPAEKPKNNFDCKGLFSLYVPDSLYAYDHDNGSGVSNCVVASVKANGLPPVGNLAGDGISFVFTTSQGVTQAVDAWADAFFKDSESNYKITVVNKTTVTLNSGQDALLVRGDGGHYGTKDYYFFYKKGDLGIMTSWDSTSKLSDKAKEVVLTIQ